MKTVTANTTQRPAGGLVTGERMEAIEERKVAITEMWDDAPQDSQGGIVF